MEKYKGKNVLIVGLGKTGFALINLFNHFECQVRVTDIKPIFDLNKQIKKLKKINPSPQTTFGEHKLEDFLEADLVIYGPKINPNLPQLRAAREKGVEVLLEPGDCMIYLGCENEHWRNPLLDKFCSQVFIHYRQTKDIKSKEELWDTRLGPGMPGYTKKDK